VIRHRTTVCVAQTGEWLGTYGSAGNGEAKLELERCCRVILQYLQQQGLSVVSRTAISDIDLRLCLATDVVGELYCYRTVRHRSPVISDVA
jgi:hypothetical protein